MGRTNLAIADVRTGELAEFSLSDAFSKTALILDDAITEEQWQEVGRLLGRMDSGVMWWWGDWWRFGKGRDWMHGEGRDWADAHGINYGTVMNAAVVANAFDFSRRRENLSFSHHQEVTAVGADADQDDLLDWAENEKASVQKLRAKVREHRGQKRIAERAAPDNRPLIVKADALHWLRDLDPVDLLFTDPPYMTDVPDIRAFAASWLPLALSKVNPSGRAFVCIGAYPEEIAAYLSVAMPTQVLVWTYRNTLGPCPTHDYKLNWQAVLYYRMPDAPPLEGEALLERFTVHDISAPDGRQDNRYHSWQKPDELARRLISQTTQRGQRVADPFCCTGTFLIEASRLGCEAIGCDIDEAALAIAEARGCRRQ
jgi:16S rRNA G966 N2-methylase RsmD